MSKYTDTIDFLYSRLPMFHRIGAAAYRANLDNITAISAAIGNPENSFRSVHIAGTNGKGSVSSMLASVFMEAGYKTGLFTSPHLKDFRERIRINGEMIGEDDVISFVDDYRNLFSKVEPSFFEWTTALAFMHFARQRVDVAIIETGLGGRLDSTNIITPELSVITNISYDHINLLGDTLELIAGEKAGIIKTNVPVVVGERQSESAKVFERKAEECKAKIIFASDHFTAIETASSVKKQTFDIYRNNQIYLSSVTAGLRGNYQSKNICTVAQSAVILRDKFPKLDDSSFMRGVENVVVNTGLRGRWEILQEDPLVVADIAHNEAGIRYSVEQLNELMSKRSGRLRIVFGVVKDKDVTHILALLPVDAEYFFTAPDLPRALAVDDLFNLATSAGLSGEKYSTVQEAVNTALKRSSPGDVIYIGGSTFVVAEAV